MLEENEVPSSWPKESSLEAAEVESVPAVKEREFLAAIEEAKAPEIAPEAPEAPFEDLKEKASGWALGGRLHEQGCHASGRPWPRPADVRTRPTIPRTSAGGRPTEADGCPVRRGPSAIAVHRKPSASAVRSL
jgi:hypothetical protein